MEVVDFKVKGRQNLELSCIKVEPKKEPKAVIQIFHGMGEHKNRYEDFMIFMAENGYAVYAHDHRKHGASVYREGEHGMFTKADNWDELIDDCYFVSRQILKEHPGKKVIILGHSLGSIIARVFIARYNTIPHAAIIMGTLAPMGLTKLFPLKTVAGILNIFKGSKRSEFMASKSNDPLYQGIEGWKTKYDWLSYDVPNVDKYIEDPLCGYAYTPKFYIEFVKGIKQAQDTNLILEGKDIPLLFISGQEDPVGDNGVGVKKVREMYSGHGLTQLKLKLVDNARHEILQETNKKGTYDFLLNWVDSNL